VTSRVTVYKCPDGTDFPVEWEDPADEQYGWRWDQIHCPLPLTPLSAEFTEDITQGFNRSFDVMGAPTTGQRLQVHGYRFQRSVPWGDDPAVRAAIRQRDEEQRVDRILELWNSEYRPEAEMLTHATRTICEPDLSLRELMDRLEQVHAARRRLGELHMLTMGPAGTAANRFIDFCIAEFGAEGEAISSELMQGIPNKSLESGIAVWELSREVKERPEVAQLLRTENSSRFLEGLSAVKGGREFSELLSAFLDEHGHRNESFNELSMPTWREDPSFALTLLRRYLDASDDASPAAMHRSVVKRRDERLAEVEHTLASEPEKLEKFRAWLKSAQQRTVVLEDHNFYIDQRGWSAARGPCLVVGKRLAEQGSIAATDDVFYLRGEEIAEAAANPLLQLQGRVAERRAERERWLHVLPPLEIGRGVVPENVAFDRFWGPKQNEPQTDGLVKGVAASRGQKRGTARVILTLEEAERLGPGEVLVTYATAPPWTPLFAVAGAVVTDVGGVLSHCAVVAREYGIPAVVGAQFATQRIPDGALVTVDGTNGTIQLEAK
jgi:pyruvate,water dikinase